VLAGEVQGAKSEGADGLATGEMALAKELNRRGNRWKNVEDFLPTPFGGV